MDGAAQVPALPSSVTSFAAEVFDLWQQGLGRAAVAEALGVDDEFRVMGALAELKNAGVTMRGPEGRAAVTPPSLPLERAVGFRGAVRFTVLAHERAEARALAHAIALAPCRARRRFRPGAPGAAAETCEDLYARALLRGAKAMCMAGKRRRAREEPAPPNRYRQEWAAKWDRAIALARKGWDKARIAAATGLAEDTIRRGLSRRGVPLMAAGGKAPPRRGLANNARWRTVRRLAGRNVPRDEIAREVGITVGTLQNGASRRGIELPPSSSGSATNAAPPPAERARQAEVLRRMVDAGADRTAICERFGVQARHVLRWCDRRNVDIRGVG